MRTDLRVTKCFADNHLTMGEAGLWNYARRVSHESRVFQQGAGSLAVRFKGMSERTANRRIQSLVKEGWFVEIAEKGRRGSWWTPAKYQVLSHEEFAEKFPASCAECQKRISEGLAAIDSKRPQATRMTDEENAPQPQVTGQAPLVTAPAPTVSASHAASGEDIEYNNTSNHLGSNNPQNVDSHIAPKNILGLENRPAFAPSRREGSADMSLTPHIPRTPPVADDEGPLIEWEGSQRGW